MIIMVSNQGGPEVGPFALDNDAWPAYKNGRPRNAAAHARLLNWALWTDGLRLGKTIVVCSPCNRSPSGETCSS